MCEQDKSHVFPVELDGTEMLEGGGKIVRFALVADSKMQPAAEVELALLRTLRRGHYDMKGFELHYDAAGSLIGVGPGFCKKPQTELRQTRARAKLHRRIRKALGLGKK